MWINLKFLTWIAAEKSKYEMCGCHFSFDSDETHNLSNVPLNIKKSLINVI